MKEKQLHIISFDNPYPANYGGAIDVFYKIEALHAIGIHINLHCFTEDKVVPEQLKQLCDNVYFYPKRTALIHLLSTIPYRVKIRYHKKMVQRILEDNHPILFEGLHTTQLFKHKEVLDRTLLVRAHNIEHDYSKGLARSSKNILWKGIHYLEALRFKKYEQNLHNVTNVLSLSHYEYEYFNKAYKNAIDIPVFHGGGEVKELSDKGKYALYHGDLSISDNVRAVEFLIEIFKKNKYPFVIASGTRQQCIDNKIRNTVNISYVQIKNDTHLDELLEGAHINVLYSFQRSGTKLKLINALYKSRFCIINENITDEPKVLSLCELASTKEAFLATIAKLKDASYQESKLRKAILPELYDVKKNAQKIAALLAEK